MNKEQNKIKILLVEDHAPDRAMISNAIGKITLDHTLIIAESIDEALKCVNENTFDCIFLDYYFPEKCAIDFLREVEKYKLTTGIIMVTSHEDINMAIECMKMGASDYLTKNQITVESISKCINYVLKLKRSEDSKREIEHRLLDTELKLKSIIARSPITLFNFDKNGEITLFRGKSSQNLDIRPDSMVGKNIQDVWKNTPIHIDDYHKACKGEQLQFKSEVNGHFYDVNYIPVKNEMQQLTGMMGVAIDITSFKKNEAELKTAILESEASSKIKEQFLANMSHEIRTPIHGIISLTQFIMSTSLTDEQTNYLDLIKKSAATLLVIVNDILDLSKIDSGKMEFEEVPFNLRDTIQTSVAAFIPKTIEKNIQLQTKINSDLPEYISGDPVRLTQIINNLLGNAVKFTEKGFVEIGVDVTNKDQKDVSIRFKIKDSGIGISEDKIDTIFESFTQAGSDITRKYGGTGLGLNITKQLVERQNGTINVYSKLNEGTTFEFILTFKIAEGLPMQNNATMKNIEPTPNKQLNILVAEDHDINRFIISKMLNEWGFKHEFATTGIEAVELAKNNIYDLILMDVEMPDMNGYKATEIIRSEQLGNTKVIPIVAMTGNAMTGERERCLSCGMNEYISKPFKPEELKEMILNLTNEDGPSANTEAPSTAMKTESKEKITDLTFLREISDNNDSFFKDFIQMFLTNTPKSIDDMKNAANNLEWEKLRQAAHKVKPSFNYVGLKDLNQWAAKIEELAKNNSNIEEVKSLLDKITNTITIAFAELEEEINSIAQ